MIPRRSISLISNSLMSAGGRRIPEAVIERDYVLAWLLSGLAGHPLRELLAFKGGTALRRCWFADYRFSEDLDFTLTRPISLEEILARLNEIFAAIEAACGRRIAFDREDRHGHQNSHTFYLRYQGPLPAANDVKVNKTSFVSTFLARYQYLRRSKHSSTSVTTQVSSVFSPNVPHAPVRAL